ncbi:hypothetical protein GRI62_07535 [Erythrobacter arachoides]|uniref:Uncharacterized protein n=1 Tax=Aurantiacibacter arachoides TaxID=1850444 RepID=A0A845A3F3_9SPHN|nr:hypothetical protein [Aurantiacibacter arachoides]MXO93457.1 hypothetical protein [Aurantiacibacter arachoides]GGD49230.1 hypothetical protein GCM10011411_06250 [Aurantiacibacter arachoides]
MNAPQVRIEVVPRGESAGPPTSMLLTTAGILALGTILITTLVAALLHRLAKRISPTLRALLAGMLPVLLMVSIMFVNGSRAVGFEAAVRMMMNLEPRGYAFYAAMLLLGLLTARQMTRWLARRAARSVAEPARVFD